MSIGTAYLASQLGGILQAALSLGGLIGGPSVAIYSMGFLLPFVNTYVSSCIKIKLSMCIHGRRQRGQGAVDPMDFHARYRYS